MLLVEFLVATLFQRRLQPLDPLQQMRLVRFFEMGHGIGKKVAQSVHHQCRVLDHVNSFEHIVEGSACRWIAADEEPGLQQ